MKSVNDEITEAFFAYLRDRNISDETKFAWFEKQRVETGIGYVDYYNGLINMVDEFLKAFERIHESKKENLYFIKKITKDQVEAILTEENLGIPLHQYTNGRLNGFYYYNEAKKDKEFFKKALENAQIKDIKETVNTAKGLLQEYIDKTAPYHQPSKGDFPRLRTQKPSLNINQLEALYSQLKENGYIAQDTGKELFVWLFGGKVEPQPFKPIKWEKNKTLLVYLIDNLCYDSTYSFNLWKNAEEIFSVKSMAVVKQNYFGNKKTVGKPVGYEEIDSIIDIMRGV